MIDADFPKLEQAIRENCDQKIIESYEFAKGKHKELRQKAQKVNQ